jgi:histidine triad (HIT) family protein
MKCIFCEISIKKIPSEIIYENNNILAFKDAHPVAPIHILLIPKKHIGSMNYTTKEDQLLLGELLLEAKQIAKNLGVSNTGYRIVINTNEYGGQTVDHLHVHLLADRKMSWPPG